MGVILGLAPEGNNVIEVLENEVCKEYSDLRNQ
jgi:hypothetical protein